MDQTAEVESELPAVRRIYRLPLVSDSVQTRRCVMAFVGRRLSDPELRIAASAGKRQVTGIRMYRMLLDRDTTGRRLVSELCATFGTRVHDDSIMYDGYKDLNDYLCCDNDRKLGYVKNWHMEGIGIYT